MIIAGFNSLAAAEEEAIALVNLFFFFFDCSSVVVFLASVVIALFDVALLFLVSPIRPIRVRTEKADDDEFI